MLQIQNISKEYRTGELVQRALDGVSLSLRDNEFVSILGPSGSGKTTLLNIVGGLDRYDSGDLVINGTSTKEYRDRDWDAYRNHSIGFVFQSYNLIPHQSILANVELALTIGGVSRGERRERARKALEEVGLGEQLHKRPSQLSGGQMQRVAIARALVNDPEILLADEPTGALDSETSVQVMELLKRVAEDRLVVMVTHNPELAERYSTRIVRLRDGNIVDDSDPFRPGADVLPQGGKPAGKAKMSFGTALSLSFHNLRTKKGRTILTAFAGSIGIIGIALILALSSGVDAYIADIQRETMTSYPITLASQAVDMSGMAGMRAGGMDGPDRREARRGVYADTRMLEAAEAMAGSIKENDLTQFKKYLDDPDSEIHQYLGENGVAYSYGVSFQVYSYDAEGVLVPSDADPEGASASSELVAIPMENMQRMRDMRELMAGGSSGAENFEELMPGMDGAAISPILTGSYELLYGAWPGRYDEVVLVLDEDNSIPAEALYQLGLITRGEYKEMAGEIQDNGEAPERAWDYEDICAHGFYALPASAHYVEDEGGVFTYVGGEALQVEPLLEGAVKLEITGVIRPKEGAANATLAGAVGYTSLLTDYMIGETDQSPVVLAQERDKAVNVLNGMAFEALTDQDKADTAAEYLSRLGAPEKSSFYSMVLYYQAQKQPQSDPDAAPRPGEGAQGGMAAAGAAQMDESAMAAMLDQWLAETPDPELLLSVYEQYIAGGSYADNMKAFGKVSYEAPSSISLYTDSFEDKEAVSACIGRYNQGRPEEEQITYTDYVAILTGSITTIVDVISYVLIAFVAVSLIVSSIMIGIITHISVLERTKEIGILRAVGASKGNVSQVFNAETVIIGLLAGVLGVGVTVLLTFPINSLLQSLLGAAELSAALPLPAAALLVLLSVGITVVAGLIPAKSAARKDPVAALRSE